MQHDIKSARKSVYIVLRITKTPWLER